MQCKSPITALSVHAVRARRISACRQLQHLKAETRAKLQRMYDEGEAGRGNAFLDRLRCLHCGQQEHCIGACPELRFMSRDDRCVVCAASSDSQCCISNTVPMPEYHGLGMRAPVAVAM